MRSSGGGGEGGGSRRNVNAPEQKQRLEKSGDIAVGVLV